MLVEPENTYMPVVIFINATVKIDISRGFKEGV